MLQVQEIAAEIQLALQTEPKYSLHRALLDKSREQLLAIFQITEHTLTKAEAETESFEDLKELLSLIHI